MLLLIGSPVHADGGAPNLAYVAGTGQGVAVIDIAQRKVTTTFSVHGDPASVLLSLDGRLLYVAQPALRQVTVLATTTKRVVCVAHVSGSPTLLALDSSQQVLYVASNTSHLVTAFRATNCASLYTLSLHGSVYGLALANANGSSTSSNTQLWVASSNELAVFGANGKILATLPFPQGPRFICIPTGGTTAYITTQQGQVVAVDTSSYALSSPLLVGKSFGAMDYDATTGEIYVPNLQEREIDILAPVVVGVTRTLHEPIRRLSFTVVPQSIAITSDGQLGMIALANGTVAMLDVPSRQVITTIAVGGQPHFIITGLYPPPSNLTQQQFSLLNIALDDFHYLIAVVVVLTAVIAVLRYRRITKRSETSQK
jgi:DNA-binding beta-propeller fold protein YncE